MYLVSIVPCDSCVPEKARLFYDMMFSSALDYGVYLVEEAKGEQGDFKSAESIRNILSEEKAYEAEYKDAVHGEFIVSIVQC